MMARRRKANGRKDNPSKAPQKNWILLQWFLWSSSVIHYFSIVREGKPWYPLLMVNRETIILYQKKIFFFYYINLILLYYYRHNSWSTALQPAEHSLGDVGNVDDSRKREGATPPDRHDFSADFQPLALSLFHRQSPTCNPKIGSLSYPEAQSPSGLL